ncbi:unnamed protein product [Dicrocoelium dendriticum]|nr:unnamed protein product [Dicrocoelium dendriticum]
MQRHLGWLARNKLFRLSLRNDFARPSESTLSLADKFSQVCTDIASILSFNSTVYENYLNAVSIQYTRRNFRSGLKLLFFTIWGALFTTSLNTGRFDVTTMDILAFALLSVVFVYLYTYNQYSHLWYSRYSCVLLTMSFTAAIIHFSNVLVRWTSIVPYLKLLISLCIILPVRLDLTLSLIIMFSIAFVAISHRQHQFINCSGITNASIYDNNLLYHVLISKHDCNTLKKVTPDMILQFIICSVVITSGMHLQFWNAVRRRAAFIYIGQAVHLQKRIRKAQAIQDSLLRVLMPQAIWQKYWSREQSRPSFGKRQYYIQPNVSVTFVVVELVNFRELSANGDMQRLMQILSDMLDYFDLKAEEYNCNRLSAYADSYVYTGGVIKTRLNHARTCVDFALELSRVNEHLTLEGNALVLLRTGIHTGSATVIVWGCKKVHYDLLGRDLLLAHHVKDSSPPGYVTISETTHEHVFSNYPVDPGSRLVVQMETVINGRRQMGSTILQTYHVRQTATVISLLSDSTILKSELGLFGHCVRLIEQFRSSRSRQATLLSQEFASDPLPTSPAVGRRTVFSISPGVRESPVRMVDTTVSRWNRDKASSTESGKPYQLDAEVLRLVTELRADPKRQITLMQYLPIGHWTNVFLNKELEWHYVNHVRDPTHPIYIDSLKLAPALDALVLLLSAILLLACSYLFTKHLTIAHIFHYLYTAEAVFALLLTVSIVWTSTRFNVSGGSQTVRRLFGLLSKSFFGHLFMFILIIMPTIHTMLYAFLCKSLKEHRDTFHSAVVSFQLTGMVNHMTSTTSPQWLSASGLLFSTVCFIAVHQYFVQPKVINNTIINPNLSLRLTEMQMIDCIIDACLNVVLVWLMLNINDRNCRLNFICMRELQICRQESELHFGKMRETMAYVLPAHMVRQLIGEPCRNVQATLRRFNTTVHNVAVGVLYFSNLYSTHTPLGHERWVESLKILNVAICAFDELLATPRFSELDRVRFVNDQMVMTSGLDQTAGWDELETFHLDELLEFGIEIKRRMTGINKQYLPEKLQLHLNFGVTRGTVKTGVIGMIKPVFAVWGPAVQLAETVARAGYPNEVLATSNCTKHLATMYEVIFSGVIAAGDSGLIDTYIVRSLR